MSHSFQNMNLFTEKVRLVRLVNLVDELARLAFLLSSFCAGSLSQYDAYLIYCVFTLLAVHLRDVDDFHDISVSISDGLHLNGVAKTTLSNHFQFAIPVHIYSISFKFKIIAFKICFKLYDL